MTDVSAAVLSIGESYTQRALASLARQTLRLRDVIVVENVSPFHRALNEAARRVKTPFFVQVDADMTLDATCVEVLRAAVRDDTGITIAELRDPLMGPVVGIKLFRTECFRHVTLRDTISPDTDFVADLDRAGWRTLYIGGREGDQDAPQRTYGEHRPDYTPAYTYRKFFLEGRRCRYRGAQGALRWRFARLEQVAREIPELAYVAQVGQVAAATGFFLASERDGLTPLADDPRQRQVFELLSADEPAEGIAAALPPFDGYRRLRDVFHHFMEHGQAIATARNGATFRATFAALAGAGDDWRVLVAKVALCYGTFSPESDAAARLASERALRAFVTLGISASGGLREQLRTRASQLAARLRGHGTSTRW